MPNSHGGKKLIRRAYPPPTTAALDDDFDALTLPATSMRGSQWVQEEYADSAVDEYGPERTFGGAVEVTVRAASRYSTVHSERIETPRTMESRTRSVSLAMGSAEGRVNGTRNGNDRRMAPPSEADGRWESLGRRARQPKVGGVGSSGSRSGWERYRMVEHKVLEDGPERTISVWREEVAKSSDGDGSTLAGDVDEFGRRSEVDSHAHRRRASTSSKKDGLLQKVHRNGYANGKLFDVTAPPESGLGLSNVSDPFKACS